MQGPTGSAGVQARPNRGQSCGAHTPAQHRAAAAPGGLGLRRRRESEFFGCVPGGKGGPEGKAAGRDLPQAPPHAGNRLEYLLHGGPGCGIAGAAHQAGILVFQGRAACGVHLCQPPDGIEDIPGLKAADHGGQAVFFGQEGEGLRPR